MEIFQIIKELNKKLIILKDNISLGLENGKMGMCVYFSCLNEYEEYEYNITQLIDDIYNQIHSLLFHDIKKGLIGIGLGLSFLIEKKHLKGDINVVLEDVDSNIIRLLNKTSYRKKKSISEQCEFLYYFLERLLLQNDGGELKVIFQEYIIILINDLYEKLNMDLFDDPQCFNTDYTLPLLLYILSKIISLKFYNYKIYRLLQDISFQILSKIPYSHANRLYLIWGMNTVNKQLQNKYWSNHICLLHREFDFHEMLNNEFNNHRIYFNNGLPVIYLLIKALPEYFTHYEIREYNRKIISKIEQSPEWEQLLYDENYFVKKSGLLDGWSGTSLLLYYEKRFK